MAIFVFILFVLLIVYGRLIAFYKRSWNQIPAFSPAGQHNINDPGTGSRPLYVSVIIAVRNEERNIFPLLSSLEKQQYPNDSFEIIIIDDHSDDKTWQRLQEIASDQLNIIILKNNERDYSKKKAIETGINVARGELIITTDADCRFSPLWIASIASFYLSNNAKFIAAPVVMNQKKSLAGIFQSLDFLSLQGITGASVYKHFHTMCNGANLAYEKKAFFEVNGFEGIDMIPSGDDMLLMYKIYKRYPENVFYLKSQEAIVSTDPEKTWKDFFHQRIRWASKATHYEDKRIFYVLLLVYLLNTGLAAMAIACIWNISWLFLLLLLILAKTVIEYPFVNTIAIFFNQQKLMKYFAVLQPLHILYIIIAGWLGKFGSYQWKNRKVKQP